MRIALLQTSPSVDGPGPALNRLGEAADRAAAAKADVLITPEMYLTGYNIGAEAVRAAAEPSDGPMLARVSALARVSGVALLVGVPELSADGRVYNAAAFMDSTGATRSLYRKTHLFGDVDRAQFSAGNALSRSFEFEGWVVALAICYDIEFPELARAHARAGVEVILTPTANMVPYDGVATRMVPARAEENALYVAYANYSGSEGEFQYCGLSCICGPDGEDLARAGRGEELIFGDLSKQQLRATRAHSTHLRDVRPELYRHAECEEQRHD